MVGWYNQISGTNSLDTEAICLPLICFRNLWAKTWSFIVWRELSRLNLALLKYETVQKQSCTTTFSKCLTAVFFHAYLQFFCLDSCKERETGPQIQAGSRHPLMAAPPCQGKHCAESNRGTAKVKGGRKVNAPSQSWTQPPGLISPGLKWY